MIPLVQSIHPHLSAGSAISNRRGPERAWSDRWDPRNKLLSCLWEHGLVESIPRWMTSSIQDHLLGCFVRRRLVRDWSKKLALHRASGSPSGGALDLEGLRRTGMESLPGSRLRRSRYLCPMRLCNHTTRTLTNEQRLAKEKRRPSPP